jgi:hypothetical protein
MYYGEKGMYRWMVPSRASPLPLLLPSRYLLLATRLTTPAAPARAQGTEALTVNDLTVGWSEPVSEAVSVPSTSGVGDGQLDGRRGEDAGCALACRSESGVQDEGSRRGPHHGTLIQIVLSSSRPRGREERRLRLTRLLGNTSYSDWRAIG